MTRSQKHPLTRRAFTKSLALGTAAAAIPSGLLAASDIIEEEEISASVKRNISSFNSKSWEPYFSNLKNAAILVDTASRALHYWSEDGETYKLYPTSGPISEELTRLGRTRVTRKKIWTGWRPTPAMKKRNPEWPDYVGPGEDNPLGTLALYLSWKYYRIHGTKHTRKIGGRSSNGCICLYDEHIAELIEITKIGTQVLLI